MSDVIIAIVPAAGHEALVATVPSVLPHMAFMEPERPALLTRCAVCSRWDCVEYAHWMDDRTDLPRALVLHAPGGPRLGMVRAMEAAGAVGDDAFVGARFGRWGGLVPAVYLDRVGLLRPVELNVEPPESMQAAPYLFPWALAHLLVQVGKGSEVLTFPVTP